MDFIWSKGSRRISFLQLCKPSTKGGFGFPNLALYYNAAEIRNEVTYLSNSADSWWIQIEAASVSPFELKEIVWNQPKERPKSLLVNPYVTLTLQIWDRSRRFLTSSPSFVLSFMGQAWFPPAASPSAFKIWRTRFCDMATAGGPLSKAALEGKFRTSLPWFQYCQVYDLYNNYYLKYKSDRDMAGFENLLNKPGPSIWGVISVIYKDLGGKMWDTPAPFQKAWDKDCVPVDSEKRWKKIWSSSLYKSKSQYVRVQHFKLLSRWYLTPVRLYHMKAKGDALCWKECGDTGGFIHCWWSCPAAQMFWKAILQQTCKMTSLRVPFSPVMVLLDVWEDIHITGYTRELLSLCFLAAKCTWAKFWKSKKIPTFKGWIIKLWDLIVADKLSKGVQRSVNPSYVSSFLEQWFLFVGYAEEAHYLFKWRPRKYKCSFYY